jgi:hypothetical protein
MLVSLSEKQRLFTRLQAQLQIDLREIRKAVAK